MDRSSHVHFQPLLNLRRRRIALALIVDPTDFEIVALLAAFKTELDVRILGDRRSPVRDEDGFAVIFEGQFPDEVRRNERAVGVLDEAGIHRVLDQRLDFGGLSARDRTHTNGRCHIILPQDLFLRMIWSENRLPLSGSCAYQPPQPPTVTLTSLVVL